MNKYSLIYTVSKSTLQEKWKFDRTKPLTPFLSRWFGWLWLRSLIFLFTNQVTEPKKFQHQPSQNYIIPSGHSGKVRQKIICSQQQLAAGIAYTTRDYVDLAVQIFLPNPNPRPVRRSCTTHKTPSKTQPEYSRAINKCQLHHREKNFKPNSSSSPLPRKD